MPRYDFRCAAGHVFEDIVSRDTRSVPCSCGQRAQRELSVPSLITARASTPSDQREFKMGAYREAAQEVEHHYQKLEYERDGPVARPDYTTIAKQRAAAATAGKIAPPRSSDA